MGRWKVVVRSRVKVVVTCRMDGCLDGLLSRREVSDLHGLLLTKSKMCYSTGCCIGPAGAAAPRQNRAGAWSFLGILRGVDDPLSVPGVSGRSLARGAPSEFCLKRRRPLHARGTCRNAGAWSILGILHVSDETSSDFFAKVTNVSRAWYVRSLSRAWYVRSLARGLCACDKCFSFAACCDAGARRVVSLKNVCMERP